MRTLHDVANAILSALRDQAPKPPKKRPPQKAEPLADLYRRWLNRRGQEEAGHASYDNNKKE